MTEETKSGISRRTLAKGAAWSVPAVAVAAAAPAYALSAPGPSLTYEYACKFPGNSCSSANKGYAMVFTAKNESANTIYVCKPTLSNIVFVKGSAVLTPTAIPGGCVEIEPGDTGKLFFFVSGSTDSANTSFYFDISIPWGHSCPCAEDESDHAPIVLKNLFVPETPPKGLLCVCDDWWVGSGERVANFVPAPGTAEPVGEQNLTVEEPTAEEPAVEAKSPEAGPVVEEKLTVEEPRTGTAVDEVELKTNTSPQEASPSAEPNA